MTGFRVVIGGGGIAAVEALLRLRRLVGDAVDVTMIAPDAELRYRPLAVQEPFAGPGARRYALARIAGDTGAAFVHDALEWVDPDGQAVHTLAGEQYPFDALLLAYGARSAPPHEHAVTFDDANADETYLGIVRSIEGGYTKHLGLIVPTGHAWPLPVYELALQTADRAYDSGFDDVTVTVVTPEAAPLEVFGTAVSEAAREALVDAGVRLLTGARAEVPAHRTLVVDPGGHELEPETIVALPRIEGRALRGVAADADGFIPIDDRCRVQGMGEHVFAAGDATSFPVKQGGIGAQQADVAAAGIAALAGDHEPARFEPVLRGSLIAGERRRLYFQARLEDGRAVESEVLDEPPWEAGEKVVAEELGPYLAKLGSRG
ncbi:MAG: FAD-dependent oxidoreductase [Thermoleophilaceae bacterium]|nr:FAD-dependent oxidoreductase [Thermoleophilaceae bacterium]